MEINQKHVYTAAEKLRRWMQGENFNSVEGPSCKKADVERLGLQPHQTPSEIELRRIMRLKESNRNVLHLKTRIFGTLHVTGFDLYTHQYSKPSGRVNYQILQQVIWPKKQFGNLNQTSRGGR